MATFPSPEWLDAYKDALNSSEQFREEAKDWKGTITLVVEAEPDKDVPFDSWALFDLRDDERVVAKVVNRDEGERARYVISAPYSTWKSVIRGRLEPVKGMLQGKLKLAGDIHEIRERVKAVALLVSIAAEVTTEFPDER